MDDKLTDLETRLAFQEQEIQILNDVIIKQQAQINELSAMLRQLEDRVKDMKPQLVVSQSEETPPPHY